MPAAKPTQKLIERAIAAWQEAGFVVGAVEVKPDGTVRIEGPAVAPDRESEQGNRKPTPWT